MEERIARRTRAPRACLCLCLCLCAAAARGGMSPSQPPQWWAALVLLWVLLLLVVVSLVHAQHTHDTSVTVDGWLVPCSFLVLLLPLVCGCGCCLLCDCCCCLSVCFQCFCFGFGFGFWPVSVLVAAVVARVCLLLPVSCVFLIAAQPLSPVLLVAVGCLLPAVG